MNPLSLPKNSNNPLRIDLEHFKALDHRRLQHELAYIAPGGKPVDNRDIQRRLLLYVRPRIGSIKDVIQLLWVSAGRENSQEQSSYQLSLAIIYEEFYRIVNECKYDRVKRELIQALWSASGISDGSENKAQELAFDLFNKATAQKNLLAYFYLAGMYWEGRGTNQDRTKAYKYYSDYLEQDSSDKENMTHRPFAEKRRREWLATQQR